MEARRPEGDRFAVAGNGGEAPDHETPAWSTPTMSEHGFFEVMIDQSDTTEGDRIVWHPRLGYIRADHACHLADSESPDDPVVRDAEQRERQGMRLDPEDCADCCGDEADRDDCHAEGEERIADTTQPGIARVQGLLKRDEDIDAEQPEEPEEPEATVTVSAATMARIADEVTRVAREFVDMRDALFALRSVVRELREQNAILIAALRGQDFDGEDAPSEGAKEPAEEPVMLN
jgi:hypothetical protein